MGKEKTTTKTDNTQTSATTQAQTQTQTVQQTPEEKRMNELAVQREEATNPGMIGAQTAGLSLVEQLLRGQEPLPGFFDKLSRGISPEVTSDIVRESLADITPQFAQSGLLDSGVRAVVGGRIAGDIRRGSEEFNLGNRLNLLNLALSGQAQVQQPILAQSSLLSSRLAGLRSMTNTGTASGTFRGTQSGTSTVLGMNPFIKSFQTNYGAWLGGGAQKAAMGGGG